MRINNINMVRPSFNGRVYMNYNNLANTIKQMPTQTQESVIGNINSLKERLESQTPDYKTYVIGLDYSKKAQDIYSPTHHKATITVKDEKGYSSSQDFELGQTGGSGRKARNIMASGEEIWNNGFRPITEKVLTGQSTPTDEDAIAEIKAVIKKRGWAEEDREYPWVNYDAIGAPTEEEIDEIKSIYDCIEDRGKVRMNKAGIAVSIWRVTSVDGCPDEIRESLIGNINTITRRIEEETAKEKSYYFSVINNYSNGYSSHGLEIEAGTNGSYYSQHLKITDYGKESDWKNYCVTDSEQIYRKVFKPLTDKTLWDGHHYLPFNKDWQSREIVNKLS